MKVIKVLFFYFVENIPIKKNTGFRRRTLVPEEKQL